MVDTLPRVGDASLFPSLQADAYLNYAGVSPISAPVQRALEVTIQDFAEHGVAAALRGIERADRLRDKVGAWLSVPRDTIGFVPNTTIGVNLVSLSLPWKPGDRVLLFEGEFPANVTPWQQAAKLFDLELVFLPTAPFYRSVEEGLACVDHAVAEGVRLLAVSLVQFQTGFRMPIEALASRVHQAGGEVFVDGIQGVGIVPFRPEEEGVDYLACGGHKWTTGVQGAGFVHVKKACAERFVARSFGWGSHEDAWDFLFKGAGHLRYDRPFRKDASVVEGGSPSALGLAALEAAFDTLASLGIDAIFDHVQRYHDALLPVLEDLGFQSLRAADPRARSGSLAAKPPKACDGASLVSLLAEHGVVASLPDGNLRFAPHYPNSVEEIPKVRQALQACLKQTQ